MKKLIVAFCMSISLPAMSQTILLACQGMFEVESKPVNQKLKVNSKLKDYVYVNITIDSTQQTIILGPSRATVETAYPLSVITHSNFFSSGNYTNETFIKDMVSISIDRYTGKFEFSRWGEYRIKDSVSWTETKGSGTCQVGVHWQQKF